MTFLDNSFILLMFQGMPTIVDDTNIVIRSDFVLSLGAPKAGLLAALGTDPKYEKWKLFVADIGISNTAWKKFGTKRRHGIDYGHEWVAALKYQANAD